MGAVTSTVMDAVASALFPAPSVAVTVILFTPSTSPVISYVHTSTSVDGVIVAFPSDAVVSVSIYTVAPESTIPLITWLVRFVGLTTALIANVGVAVSIVYISLLTSSALPAPSTPKNLNVVVLAMLIRSEEHTSELQSRLHLVCRLLLEKNNK